jgi:phage-related protein
MVKKTTKKPSKNGTKQKQKQKQTVIVNINNGKTRVKRQPVKPPSKLTQYPQYINTYPVFIQSEPSPPIIYNRPDISSSALKTPVEEQTNISVALKTPKKTPVKKRLLKKNRI